MSSLVLGEWRLYIASGSFPTTKQWIHGGPLLAGWNGSYSTLFCFRDIRVNQYKNVLLHRICELKEGAPDDPSWEDCWDWKELERWEGIDQRTDSCWTSMGVGTMSMGVGTMGRNPLKNPSKNRRRTEEGFVGFWVKMRDSWENNRLYF